MKKVAISFIILGGSFVLCSNLTSANNEEVIYDLSNHQSIESFELEEDGDIVSVTIIDDSLLKNLDYKIIQPFRLADKTYTISKNKKNSWSISYKVSIKNNRITSAHSKNFKAVQGSFSNTSVTRHSNSSASAKGAWKYRSATNSIQVKKSVVNNNLSVQ